MDPGEVPRKLSVEGTGGKGKSVVAAGLKITEMYTVRHNLRKSTSEKDHLDTIPALDELHEDNNDDDIVCKAVIETSNVYLDTIGPPGILALVGLNTVVASKECNNKNAHALLSGTFLADTFHTDEGRA